MSLDLKINNIFLLNYRNHKELRVDVDKNIILIFGENGSGKTNILESISLLRVNSGFRGSKLLSIINNKQEFNDNIFGAKFCLTDSDGMHNVVIKIKKRLDQYKKIIKLNDKEVSLKAFHEKINMFWILPKMNNIFLSSSSERRIFLDSMIFSYDLNHKKSVSEYNKLQKERLKIIKHFNDKSFNAEWLDIIERKLASLGVIICDARRQFSKKINFFSSQMKTPLPKIQLSMKGELDLEFEKNPALSVEENLVKRFFKNRKVDSIIGKTSLSVNQTDFDIFNENNKQFAVDCSTGEQKVILVSIIFLFIQVLKEKKFSKIIFLLDDIFAFLDNRYSSLIFQELLDLNIQTWITNVNKDCIKEDSKFFHNVKFINIEDIRM